jgi:hypothetical protein
MDVTVTLGLDQIFARSLQPLQLLHFHPPLLFIMGRRARNKQGDPLPLDADPDLNGSLNRSKPKTKPGLKGRPPAPNLKPKLGKRKPEYDCEVERVVKKPKGVRPAGKSKLQAEAATTKKPPVKGRSNVNAKKADSEEDGVTDDDGSVRWEDVEGADMRAEARCVRLGGKADVLFIYKCSETGRYSVTVTQRTREMKKKSLPDFLGTWET